MTKTDWRFGVRKGVLEEQKSENEIRIPKWSIPGFSEISVVVSEELGMGLGWDWNGAGTRAGSPRVLKGQNSWKQPSSELQTKPKIFQLSPFPDYMSYALLVYMCKICSIPLTSSSQALPDAVLQMSNDVSAWDSTRELLGGEGQLQPV